MKEFLAKLKTLEFTSLSPSGTSLTTRFQGSGVRATVRQWFAIIVLVCIISVSILLFIPTRQFPAGKIITVKPESSLTSIGAGLKEARVIRSPWMFHILARLFSRDGKIQSGKYLFDAPISVVGIVYRLNNGLYGIPETSVRILEGSSVRDIGIVLEKNLENFDRELFETLAKEYEGYLYPGTYYLSVQTSPEEVIELLRTEFDSRYQSLIERYPTDKSKESIVIMASILQREAYDTPDARVISGILWKRLEKNMALQVDASVAFGLDKPGGKLTFKDLRIDTPYNTYTRKGLPVGPIGNPGAKMLRAALDPEESPYLFYLHTPDGKVYYAKTGSAHIANQKAYLR